MYYNMVLKNKIKYIAAHTGNANMSFWERYINNNNNNNSNKDDKGVQNTMILKHAA